MEKPRLMREVSPAGAMVSVRYKGFLTDYFRKKDQFTLLQFGQKRKVWFLLRTHPKIHRLPVFLFDPTSEVKWTFARFYIGTTTQPILLDKYWRTKGWLHSSTTRNTSMKTITSGSVKD